VFIIEFTPIYWRGTSSSNAIELVVLPNQLRNIGILDTATRSTGYFYLLFGSRRSFYKLSSSSTAFVKFGMKKYVAIPVGSMNSVRTTSRVGLVVRGLLPGTHALPATFNPLGRTDESGRGIWY